jgi:hypothetical protein
MRFAGAKKRGGQKAILFIRVDGACVEALALVENGASGNSGNSGEHAYIISF